MLLRVSITLISAVAALSTWAGSWIRINQVGYLPQSTKVAVLMSEDKLDVSSFVLVDAATGQVV